MRRILQPNEPETEEPQPETGHAHTIAAAGCYVIGLVFGLVALGAMWILVYTPSEYVGRILIGAITGVAIVVFLWGLLIKKW